MERSLGFRDLIHARSIDVVRHTHGNFLETRQHIEFGQEDVRQTIDSRCLPRDGRIEPAASTISSGGHTTLSTDGA